MAKNKYFDKWEFERATSFIEENPFKANKLLREYIEKFPHDYTAYSFYAGTFITLGKFNEAEKILNFIEKQGLLDTKYYNQGGKYYEFNKNLLFNKMRLLSYREDYHELYKLIVNNLNTVRKMNVEEVVFLSKYKTGRINVETEEIKRYMYKQMVEYNKEECLKHIHRHCAFYNSELDSNAKNNNIFNYDFPLEVIINEIEKYMLSDKRLYAGFVENVYIFKYDECGRQNNRLVNYFKVVCFHNTKNIITMCPVSVGESLPYIDLNYLKKPEMVKEEKISRIDKFNQKYNRTIKKAA